MFFVESVDNPFEICNIVDTNDWVCEPVNFEIVISLLKRGIKIKGARLNNGVLRVVPYYTEKKSRYSLMYGDFIKSDDSGGLKSLTITDSMINNGVLQLNIGELCSHLWADFRVNFLLHDISFRPNSSIIIVFDEDLAHLINIRFAKEFLAYHDTVTIILDISGISSGKYLGALYNQLEEMSSRFFLDLEHIHIKDEASRFADNVFSRMILHGKVDLFFNRKLNSLIDKSLVTHSFWNRFHRKYREQMSNMLPSTLVISGNTTTFGYSYNAYNKVGEYAWNNLHAETLLEDLDKMRKFDGGVDLLSVLYGLAQICGVRLNSVDSYFTYLALGGKDEEICNRFIKFMKSSYQLCEDDV